MKHKQNFLLKSNQSAKNKMGKALREYEKWRRNRPNRGLIPEHLWESAVKLCRTHSINQVVKALHLNYNALRARVESDFNPNDQSISTHKKKKSVNKKSPRFIDATESAFKYQFNSPSSNIVVEYQKADGSNLKLHIPHSADFNLQEMISFLAGELNA